VLTFDDTDLRGYVSVFGKHRTATIHWICTELEIQRRSCHIHFRCQVSYESGNQHSDRNDAEYKAHPSVQDKE